MPFRSRILRDLVDTGRQFKDPHLLVDVIQIFIEQAPLQSSELSAALQKDDIKGVIFQVHKLKTSAGVVGAEDLKTLCEQIEQHISLNLSLNLVLPLVDRLQVEVGAECARVQDELTAFLKLPH